MSDQAPNFADPAAFRDNMLARIRASPVLLMQFKAFACRLEFATGTPTALGTEPFLYFLVYALHAQLGVNESLARVFTVAYGNAVRLAELSAAEIASRPMADWYRGYVINMRLAAQTRADMRAPAGDGAAGAAGVAGAAGPAGAALAGAPMPGARKSYEALPLATTPWMPFYVKPEAYLAHIPGLAEYTKVAAVEEFVDAEIDKRAPGETLQSLLAYRDRYARLMRALEQNPAYYETAALQKK